MRALLAQAGIEQGEAIAINGPLAMRLWPATRTVDAPAAQLRELVV